MLEVLLERALSFGLFWGVWLLAPLLIDLSTAVVYFVCLLLYREDTAEWEYDLDFFPYVTVVIPVHNSADTLYKCLQSIATQSYPAHLIQVVCVNNGSQDDSFEEFQKFQHEHPQLLVMWTSLERASKSIALNAGIYAGQGSYIINVDSDAWLHRDAVLNVVRAFEKDSSLMAATASIRVDKKLGQGFDFIDVINYCEVIEYLIAFDVGRRYQNLTNTVFTLSGAFSAFRRDVLMQTIMYQERTVSEDTDLTFHIRQTVSKRQGRIGVISNAIAYVEPIESLSRLYSQRVRWQRGELEVTAMNYERIPGAAKALTDFTGRILLSDHTMGILRLIWTFLIPFLYLLGYPLPTIVLALMGLFICYMGLDAVYFLVAYKSAEEPYREELSKIWWVVLLLPFYRYLSFWFRIGGIIQGLTEPKSWKTENPVNQLINILKSYISCLKGRSFRGGRWRQI